MLDDLLASGVSPEVSFDGRDGLAVFSADGEIRWTVHFGAAAGALAWFVVSCERSGVEIHVADPARLAGEPGLGEIASWLRRDAGLG